MTGHAVVIGGGIGGLLAGHGLSRHYAKVTILERYGYPPKTWSQAPPARRGVPQSRCPHMLMAAGAAAIDELTPGWRSELVACGAVPFDVSADTALRLQSGWMPRVPSGIISYACSRALLEAVLRRRLSAHANATLLEHQQVLGLLTDRTGARVTGVHTAGPDRLLHADLVVDSSGRQSALPDWLTQLPGSAAARVPETVVASGTHYVSRWFHLDPADAPNWHCLSTSAITSTRRCAMMMRAEQDCWGVVLLAASEEPLPSDDAGFLGFAAGLGDGVLGAALAPARPMSPIHRYAPSPNRLRHCDRVSGWPEGLIAIGDSVCALDPYVGLGMTVAALGSLCLTQHVAEGHDSGMAFQKRLASMHAEPWRVATRLEMNGHAACHDTGEREQLYQAATTRADIAHAMLAEQHLLQAPDTLLRGFLS